jgi:hypothetical protein
MVIGGQTTYEVEVHDSVHTTNGKIVMFILYLHISFGQLHVRCSK